MPIPQTKGEQGAFVAKAGNKQNIEITDKVLQNRSRQPRK